MGFLCLILRAVVQGPTVAPILVAFIEGVFFNFGVDMEIKGRFCLGARL